MGAVIVPLMNSRIVRPLEIFAMNIPDYQTDDFINRVSIPELRLSAPTQRTEAAEIVLTNEGAPSDPPSPVEHGPPVHPFVGSVHRAICVAAVAIFLSSIGFTQLLEGVRVPAQLHDPLEVVADALTKEVEDVPSVVEEEDGEKQHQTQTKAEFAQAANPESDAGNGGNGGQNRDAPNDDHLEAGRGRRKGR